MTSDFHWAQTYPEDVESYLIFGNSVFLVIDVGIISNPAVNKAVSSRNHKLSGLVFCSQDDDSRVPLDGVDTHCVVQHLPCCRILHNSLCRDGEGDEGDDDGDDALHDIRFIVISYIANVKALPQKSLFYELLFYYSCH